MSKAFVPIALLPMVLVGCSGSDQRTPISSGQTQSHADADADADAEAGAVAVASDEKATDEKDKDDVSFGIPNDFSGRLTEEQKHRVPKSLQDAFYIESVRTISSAALEKETKVKDIVAEESRSGKRYVALRDFRHVAFSDDLSGHMIVIERYQVVDK